MHPNFLLETALLLDSKSALPSHERVAEQLANILLELDMLVQLVESEDTAPTLRWLVPHAAKLYDTVNSLMEGLTD